jgi:hypothetical protein
MLETEVLTPREGENFGVLWFYIFRSIEVML